MNILKSLTDLVLGKRPTTRQERRAARRAALVKMGMGARPPKHSPPPKVPGFKSGDKRKGPLAP